MFRHLIQTTAFCNEMANQYFRDKIFGEAYRQDYSFISTLRALVAPRMTDEEESIYFGVTQGASNDRILSEGEIRIFIIPDSSDFETFISRHNEQFSAARGWTRVDKITVFFRKQFQCVCFIRPVSKVVAIYIAGSLSMRHMHYLQCAIPAMLPWYFSPEDGLSDTEIALIESIRNGELQTYLDILQKIAESMHFRDNYIRKTLDGFENAFERQQLESTRANIKSYDDDLLNLNSQIARVIKRKQDAEIQLLGLETKIAQSSESSEMMNYFLCNKNLVLVSAQPADMTLVFVVKSYLTYFDEDIAKMMIDNPHSCVNADNISNNSAIAPEQMRKLMSAIFIDQSLRIKVCAAYKICLKGGVTGLLNYSFGYEGQNCLPNPHIDTYACLGQYIGIINNLLAKCEYIGALEQCIASCSSLNFGDWTVMSKFMQEMYHNNDTFIELPDGTMVSPEDAVKFLEGDGVDVQS